MKRLIASISLLLLAPGAHATGFIGDFAPATTAICGHYTTYRPSTGATYTLAGTPAVSVYKIGDGTNSTTESTTGVTHAEDVDSRTGLNRWCVDTSADGTFYSAGAQFSVVITAGTVDSVSVVGSEVGSFSLNKVAALRPTTAGRTLDVSTGGEAGIDWANVGSPTTTVDLSNTTIKTTQKVDVDTIKTNPVVNAGTITFPTGATLASTTNITAGTITTASAVTTVNGLASGVITATSIAADAITAAKIANGAIDEATYASDTDARFGKLTSGTAQAGSTGTTLVLESATDFTANDRITGATCAITGGTGSGESLTVASYVNATDTATMDGTWPTTPDNTSTYTCYRTAPVTSSGSGLDAAGVRAAVGLASANLDTQLSGIQSDTDNIQTRIPAALVSGRMDSSVGAYQTGLTPLQPTTAGRTLDVTATGAAGIDWGNVENPTTTVGLTGTTISTSQAVASVSGAVGSVTGAVGSVGAGGITASSIAADAIGASELATDAVTEIAGGVWDLATSGHTTSGTFGAAMNAAGSAGDPWATSLPGAYGAGTAGYIIGTNLNGTVTSRAAASALATAQADLDTLTGSDGVTLATSQPNYAPATAAAVAALNNVSSAQVQTAAAAALTAYDPPTRAEATSDANSVLAAIAALNNLSANNIRDIVIETQGGGVSLGCALAAGLAYAAGDLSTTGSSSTYKDPSGSQTRISGTVSSPGNRAASITCPAY